MLACDEENGKPPQCKGDKYAALDAGVMRTDRFRNDAIRHHFGVALIADKRHTSRLRWCSQFPLGKEENVPKIRLNFEASGERPRGRQKQRWSDALDMEIKVTGIRYDQAQDRKR